MSKYFGLENLVSELKGIQVGICNQVDPAMINPHKPVDEETIWNMLDKQYKSEGGQIGVYNFHTSGVPARKYKFKGFQIGAENLADDIKGFQIGLLSAAEKIHGIQIGLICYTTSGNCLQLGLITLRDLGEDEKWYKKFSPFVGYHREK